MVWLSGKILVSLHQIFKKIKNNMVQIFLTILFYIFVAVLICCVIVVIAISLANKSLLCAKIYTFIFEHDDWLLYKKAKKQGIQHYLNGCHFSQFHKEWNKVKDEYGVSDISGADYLKLGKEITNALYTKYKELTEKYYYKEFKDAEKSINDDDIVLTLNMYSEELYISAGHSSKSISWKLMVKDAIKSQAAKDRVFYALLADPKMAVSF